MTGCFSAKIGLDAPGALIGLLHDLGKYSAEFQNYLRSAAGLLDQDHDDTYVDPRKAKGKIDHSTAGAQAIWRQFQKRGPAERVIGELLSICIASHHSGLIDCLGADGTDLLSKRMQKPEALSHSEEAWTVVDQEVAGRWERILSSEGLISSLRGMLAEICRRDEEKTIVRFKVGLMVRYLFSCLIDADRTNTADFESRASACQRLHGAYENWPALLGRLERKLATFRCEDRIDELRRDVSDHCFRAAAKGRGVFTLTVPTGGGKTLASLRFALAHAARHGMDRILFVIPFTSIIDQNAEEIRKILEDVREGVTPGSVVLEHHSNLVPERQTWRNKILSENWDAPVVFTTSVQLLETLFGAGTRGVRRMHQLANSVIIFDEIQTLPVRCVHLFNNAMNFLAECCRSTIVLCSATQPLLARVDETKGALRLVHPESEIMPDPEAVFRGLSRVEVLDQRKPGGWTDEQVANLALEEARSSGSCLVVVNTKDAAKEVYRRFQAAASEFSIFHLSTNMCPSHRRARLSEMCKLLGLPCQLSVLCVSTQLIEAGIDVDFGSVIRFSAGLDSIAQAAGRCNRHGKRTKGRVYVVNPAEDKGEIIRDIRVGKGIAERVLDELARGDLGPQENALSPRAMERYYDYYFFERRIEMSYPVRAGAFGIERDDTLLNMLSENSMSVAAAARSPCNYLRQQFMAAAEAFQAIDGPGQGVIVPYEGGGQLISELCAAYDVKKEFGLLKGAQQFTVNVFPQVLRRLQERNAVHEIQGGTGILSLDSRYYDKEFGLAEYPVNLMEDYYVQCPQLD
jgi:CRISPR-associated endonuclease/helicase Cas3